MVLMAKRGPTLHTIRERVSTIIYGKLLEKMKACSYIPIAAMV